MTTWKETDGKLHKQFAFKHFEEAIAWMNALVPFISQTDHHPEWQNVYNKVDVYLITHDTGGISEKDWALAEEMDRVFLDLAASSVSGC